MCDTQPSAELTKSLRLLSPVPRCTLQISAPVLLQALRVLVGMKCANLIFAAVASCSDGWPISPANYFPSLPRLTSPGYLSLPKSDPVASWK
jgi:hypothetical protein